MTGPAPAPTGHEFVKMVADALGVPSKTTVLSKFAMRVAGFLNADIKELHEMLYQNEFDYLFDSSKFERRFKRPATSYLKGIEETIAFFRRTGEF